MRWEAVVTLGNSTTSANSTLTLDGNSHHRQTDFRSTNSYIIAPASANTHHQQRGLAPAEIRVHRGNHSIRPHSASPITQMLMWRSAAPTHSFGSNNGFAGVKTTDQAWRWKTQYMPISPWQMIDSGCRRRNIFASSITGEAPLEITPASQLTLESTTARKAKCLHLHLDGSPCVQGILDLKNSSLIVQSTSADRQIGSLTRFSIKFRTARNAPPAGSARAIASSAGRR